MLLDLNDFQTSLQEERRTGLISTPSAARRSRRGTRGFPSSPPEDSSRRDISTAVLFSLINLAAIPPEIVKARGHLTPFIEASTLVREIDRILDEELRHALDWEHQFQMNQILDRIWELAEEEVRDGWSEDPDNADVNGSEMQRQHQDQDQDQDQMQAEDESENLMASEVQTRFQSVGESVTIPEEADDPVSDADMRSPSRRDSESESDEVGSDFGSESDPDGVFARYGSSSKKQDFAKSIPIIHPLAKYTGHRNLETVKDVNFLGNRSQYVITGSDDGNFFIYSKDDSQLIGIYKGDSSVVNVLQPHPTLPIIAVSGIDDTIKIFGPIKPGGRKIKDQWDRKDEILRTNKDLNESVGRDGDTFGLGGASFLELIRRHRVIEGVERDDEDGECVIL